MADGDWGMGYGSKNNAEYVKAQKRLIPKIKKSDEYKPYL